MFKRDNTWWACFRIDGKKIRRSLGTSNKKLAENIEAKIKVDILEGTYFDRYKKSTLTIKDLVEKYLYEHSKPNKSKNTYKSDVSFSKKIIEHFGNILISDLKPNHIIKFISARRTDTVKRKDGMCRISDTTVNHELRLLRHAYNLAIRTWDLIEESPFAKVNIPTGDVKRVRYLSNQEEMRLSTALPEWLQPIVTIARETGLRLSNIANLTWKQVNLFNKMLIIETTKNGNPVGVPMTQNVYNTLKSLNKVRRLNSDFIFGKNGKPFGRWWISKSFKKTCEKAGIENFRFHDLRHDFCSKLVQRGVDLYTVAALAGHRKISTTQRYAHLCPSQLRSAIKVLNPGHNLDTITKNEQTETS